MNMLLAFVVLLAVAWVVVRDAQPPRAQVAPGHRDPAPTTEIHVDDEPLDPDHFIQTEIVESVSTRSVAYARLAGGIALSGAALGLVIVGAARALGALLRRWAGG